MDDDVDNCSNCGKAIWLSVPYCGNCGEKNILFAPRLFRAITGRTLARARKKFCSQQGHSERKSLSQHCLFCGKDMC